MLAEWRFGSGGGASLHVHCHVSGEERWLAPPGLRDFIFRREMPLVRAVYGAAGVFAVLIAIKCNGSWVSVLLRCWSVVCGRPCKAKLVS